MLGLERIQARGAMTPLKEESERKLPYHYCPATGRPGPAQRDAHALNFSSRFPSETESSPSPYSEMADQCTQQYASHCI